MLPGVERSFRYLETRRPARVRVLEGRQQGVTGEEWVVPTVGLRMQGGRLASLQRQGGTGPIVPRV